MKKPFVALLVLLAAVVAAVAAPAGGPFSPDECAQRRARLMREAGNGVIVLFGATEPFPGARFRQDNDFHYLTGVDDRNAVLVMLAARGEAFLFLPEQNPREIMVDGANLLKETGAAARLKLKALLGLSALDEFLSRQLPFAASTLYVRLIPGDTVDSDRYEARLAVARRLRTHFNDYPAPDPARAAKFRALFPEAQVRDISPPLAAMRAVKGPAEIESLRRNGRLSAEAVCRAMRATAPGAREYALAGAASGWVLGHGAQGLAFQPIAASGANACTWHYERNDAELKAGELVLLDFGADFEHLCMDVTRTWPVSGRFSPDQRRLYQAALEVQKATIAACRPGLGAADIRKIVAADLAARQVDPMGLRGDVHHFVGLSTHDGMLRDDTLQEGMVLTVEPGLYLEDKGIGIRIEDTIVITAAGCDVLTAGVPKEIADIEALMNAKAR
jgi:Xaa-Pro aminopeptidase